MSTITVNGALFGIHPRSEQLVKTTRDYDRGRVDGTALKDAFQNDTRELVELQRAAGFDLVSDGQLNWQDFLRPLSENISGLEIGADLTRWFDTNTFFRRPRVTKKLQANTDAIMHAVNGFGNSDLHEGEERTLAIPGPFTLASLVEDQFYSSKEELIHEFAKVLSELIPVLQTKYSHIQLNEPSLAYRYGESAVNNSSAMDSFVSAFQNGLSKKLRSVALHTCFGDCSAILAELLRLEEVETVGIDFTQTPVSKISSLRFNGKALGVGCFDGRSSFVEDPTWITQFCVDLRKMLEPSGLMLLASCDLKYLPRVTADRKVQAMGQAKVQTQKKLSEVLH